MPSLRLAATAFVLVVLLTDGAAFAQSKTKLPAAVGSAFKAAYPNATITGISRETEKGRTVYEIESTDAGRQRDLIYAADGTILVIEEALTEAEFPAAALAAIRTRYPKAQVKKYERVTEGAIVTYEAQLKGAPVSEVVLRADGTMVSPKPAVKK